MSWLSSWARWFTRVSLKPKWTLLCTAVNTSTITLKPNLGLWPVMWSHRHSSLLSSWSQCLCEARWPTWTNNQLCWAVIVRTPFSGSRTWQPNMARTSRHRWVTMRCRELTVRQSLVFLFWLRSTAVILSSCQLWAIMAVVSLQEVARTTRKFKSQIRLNNCRWTKITLFST